MICGNKVYYTCFSLNYLFLWKMWSFLIVKFSTQVTAGVTKKWRQSANPKAPQSATWGCLQKQAHSHSKKVFSTEINMFSAWYKNISDLPS